VLPVVFACSSVRADTPQDNTQENIDTVIAKTEKNIKVAGLLDEAKKGKAKGDMAAAERAAKDVLALEPGNAEAMKLMSDIKAVAAKEEAAKKEEAVKAEAAKAVKETKPPVPPVKNAKPKSKSDGNFAKAKAGKGVGAAARAKAKEEQSGGTKKEKKPLFSFNWGKDKKAETKNGGKNKDEVSEDKKPAEAAKEEVKPAVSAAIIAKEVEVVQSSPAARKPQEAKAAAKAEKADVRTDRSAKPEPAKKEEKKAQGKGFLQRTKEFFGLVFGRFTGKQPVTEKESIRAVRKASFENYRNEATRKVAQKKDQQAAMKYMDAARKLEAKGNLNDARGRYLKAKEKDPKNERLKELMRELDRNELFTERFDMDARKRPEQMAKNAKYLAVDQYKANKESKSFVVKLLESTQKKKYPMTDVYEGEEYTIDDCVQASMHRSSRLITADEQIKLAEMRVLEAYRDILPTFSARYESSSGRIGANSMVRHYRGNKYQFEVRQTIFDGMEKFFALRQAKANLDIVKFEKRKLVNEITEDVKKAYYSYDKTIKAFDLQVRTRDSISKVTEIAEKAYQEDLIAKAEYLKIKSQQMQANFSCTSSEEDMTLAAMVLYQTMWMEPGQKISIKTVEPPRKYLAIGLQNCYELALANRPELMIKSKVIEYYNFERKMKKAKAWPKMDFNGSFGAAYENYEPLNIDADYTSDGSGPSRDGRQMEPEWFAGVKTSVPIFGNTLEHNYVKEQWAPTVSAFRGTQSATNYLTYKFLDNLSYFSDVQEARVGFERAKYEFDKEKQDAMVQVKEMYFQYSKAMLQHDIARSQMDYEETFIKIVDERRKMGDMDMSTYIDELTRYTEQEYALIQADSDYYIAVSGLNKSIGLPDYFKPEFENTEFEDWKAEKDKKDPKKEKTAQDKASKDLKKETAAVTEELDNDPAVKDAEADKAKEEKVIQEETGEKDDNP
jgi:outer membrane protein TolC